MSSRSSNNVETVMTGLDAWNHDDLDGWLALAHPEVRCRTSGAFPDLDAVYRGHAGLAKFWRDMHAPWERLRLEPGPVEESGDWVAFPLRFRAKGIGSGVVVDLRMANAVRFEDGLAVEIVAARTIDEARAEARQGGASS